MATQTATDLPTAVVSAPSPVTERSTSTPTRVRSSRFIETPMEEYTPANSIYETDDDALMEQWDGTPTRVLLRATNAAAHLVVCVLPMAIAAEFLARQTVWWPKSTPCSITLLVILSLDKVLDFIALIQIKRRRPGWALLARLSLGIGYLVLFMVYVALGYAFPYGYSYWGMQPMYAGPVAYLFMWALGVWNLLNTALHRHQVGRDVRAWRTGWSGARVDGAGASRDQTASARAERGEGRTFRDRLGGLARPGRGGSNTAAAAEEGRRNEIRLSESRRTDQEPKNYAMTTGTASTRSARRAEEAEGDGAVRPPPVAVVEDRVRS